MVEYATKNVNTEGFGMAYETKVILISLAKHALITNSKEMYILIAEMANAEGVVLKSWDEAKAETEKD